MTRFAGKAGVLTVEVGMALAATAFICQVSYSTVGSLQSDILNMLCCYVVLPCLVGSVVTARCLAAPRWVKNLAWAPLLLIFLWQANATVTLASSWEVALDLVRHVESYRRQHGEYPQDLRAISYYVGSVNVEYDRPSADGYYVIVWSADRSSSEYWLTESGMTYIDD